MDCKTIAEDKNKIFYTYFNTLDIILANVLNRFSSIHNLKEGQHFYFNDKECVGVEMSADWGCLKTFPITAKGEVSKKGMIIHSEESIKPV